MPGDAASISYISRLGRLEEPRDNELKPNVIAEHRRSRNELSVLQHVMPLLRRESVPYRDIEKMTCDSGRHQCRRKKSFQITLGTDKSPCGYAISAVVVKR